MKRRLPIGWALVSVIVFTTTPTPSSIRLSTRQYTTSAAPAKLPSLTTKSSETSVAGVVMVVAPKSKAVPSLPTSMKL